MQQTVSYAADIIGMNRKTFSPTVRVYRDAVSYLIDVVDAEWEDISSIGGKLSRVNFIEHLVHTTKYNEAKYKEFDEKFYITNEEIFPFMIDLAIRFHYKTNDGESGVGKFVFPTFEAEGNCKYKIKSCTRSEFLYYQREVLAR